MSRHAASCRSFGNRLATVGAMPLVRLRVEVTDRDELDGLCCAPERDMDGPPEPSRKIAPSEKIPGRRALGFPTPYIFRMTSPKLKPAAWITSRFKMLS